MESSLNARQNGPVINLHVSRAQRTLDPAVSSELTAILGADAIAYSTLTKYLHPR
jgi:hypothetical protein